MIRKSFLFLFFCALYEICAAQPAISFRRSSEGINVTLTDGTLNICPLTDNALRIRFFKDTFTRDSELILIKTPDKPAYKVSKTRTSIIVKGKKITVSLDKLSGILSFADNSGKVFLKEKENSRKLVPDTAGKEPCFMAEQKFDLSDGEYLFGLGQFQDGYSNIRNITRRLTQVNSQISLPFLFSSKGYGLLWHQYGLTDFNPADNPVIIESQQASVSDNSADVTTTSGTQRRAQNQTFYSGSFTVPAE